ncbi:MAG: glutamine-synthetase adenylyltransferase, partial [Bryobacteraceae bacterium]|nr:glutamine-synthetase adenylyltransferase [Bryobacteraceae bacterium]
MTVTLQRSQVLASLAEYSRFLSDAVRHHPTWLDDFPDSSALEHGLSARAMANTLDSLLPAGVPEPGTLALFRKRQLVRILLRDVLGFASLPAIAEELSNLADAIIGVAFERICPASTMSVIALGKLGGRELNYSSDIDLMFVFNGTNAEREFFTKAAIDLTRVLSAYTPDGICYRVDLRLRPDGSLGEACISLDAAKQYYATRARDWELQMLIKARVCGGDGNPGRELLEFVEPRIYSSTLDFSAVEALSETRERIHEKLTAKRRGFRSGLDIKLARGGIRDIEFLVQCLQRLHGGREPWVRHGGTLLALNRLANKNLISASEHARLAHAYEFLRHLEHRLQFWDDRQTHSLPAGNDDLDSLARRMPVTEIGPRPSGDKLLGKLRTCLDNVYETYERVIHSQQPLYYGAPAITDRVETNAIRFLDQRAPAIAAILQDRPLRRGSEVFEAFLDRMLEDPSSLQMLNSNADLTSVVLDIFENSPYYAGELARRPSLLEAIASPTDARFEDATQLRQYFRREMLRIQAASLTGTVPIFETLGQTSDLADTAISTAYALAIQEVSKTRPQDGSYQQRDQMMVIALGRLGMREFDLGSDADLVFVLADDHAGEITFWTRVAESMIDIISAYTGDGVMFSVDTRLRPSGREGTLVQTVGACCEYLAHRAEAWEGITWMKSRCVAGNTARSIEFLHELQQVDWRRYGQSGRSRSALREMRMRLESEQGSSNPLKAGPGGYYDID